MNFTGQNIAVLGAGASGQAAAALAAARGAVVTVFDTASVDSLAPVAQSLQELAGVKLVCGEEALSPVENFDLLVTSPGISVEAPLAIALQEKNRGELIGEIELAYRCSEVPVIAITGTNGKTTTTELIASLVSEAGRSCVAAGNHGRAYCDVVLKESELDVIALEVSSFQLETIVEFRPEVAVWMNFAPDHMDRYRSLDEYLEAKQRIFENLEEEDLVVIQAGTSVSGRVGSVETFSAFGEPADWTLEGLEVVCRGESWISLDQTPLQGRHNAENLMAALGAGRRWGVGPELVEPALKRFRVPPHRCEKAGEVEGVVFVNDSKATNLHALESALRGQMEKVVLIAGGKDKGLDYGAIAHRLPEAVSEVVAIGEVGDSICEAWGERVPCRRERGLKEAVVKAFDFARPGQVVLFSPGTSSFDMFSSYVERGDAFRQCVNELKESHEKER